ncbi:MAG: monovalent cation/H+ antiporter subunit D family protein [Candidatus Puniceispirillum sp.]|nr:monovalent cation/H+ antiporter subunit D family protein [Candidatus Puniceispirillum sp.]MBL6775607.1 monovalent cation/H+ antiporter subunit D family protein [Candidatus Puniceispirillum sp.]
MMSLQTAMLVGLLAPLVVALLTPFLAVRHIWRDAAGPIGGVITFIAALEVAMAVRDGQTPRLFVAQIAEGLAIEFAVTPLGAIFGLVASGLWILAALYTVGYMRGNHEKHQTRFTAFYAVAVHAAMAVAWSGNLLVLFIFYEILTFSTYPLVTHKESAAARNAGRLYMSILVGTSVVLLLPAVVWVWLSTGTLDFRPGGFLAGQIDPAIAPILLGLFAFGVGKAALMPIHRWLPAAMVAPTPVSALLHAVAVVKAGVFTILTVVVYVFGIDFLAKTGASDWLVWLAAFTILASSMVAITKDDIKARLAYSTISQLSYIVLGAAIASSMAVQGAALHIVMHAAGKITLFFCAGAIYVQAHLTKISELDGQGREMPWVFAAFFIGALSIIGIPPLGGSWSKFILMVGAVEAGYIVILAVLGLSSLLNVYYLLEPLSRAFFRDKTRVIDVAFHPLVVVPPVLTALISIGLFFFDEIFLDLAILASRGQQ